MQIICKLWQQRVPTKKGNGRHHAYRVLLSVWNGMHLIQLKTYHDFGTTLNIQVIERCKYLSIFLVFYYSTTGKPKHDENHSMDAGK